MENNYREGHMDGYEEGYEEGNDIGYELGREDGTVNIRKALELYDKDPLGWGKEDLIRAIRKDVG